MKILPLNPPHVGIEVDVLPSSDGEWSDLLQKKFPECGGVLAFRNVDATGSQLEEILLTVSKHLGHKLLPYDRWPGQSPGVKGCPHLALLGNYKARGANEIVDNCTNGEQIAEFKPATMELSEWHTDGSFLARPKTFIALYAPMSVQNALPPTGGETRFASTKLDAAEVELYENWSSIHSWRAFMRFLEGRDPNRPKVTEEQCAAKPDQLWPLVNPSTGCVYINPKNTCAVFDRDGNEVGKGLVMKLARQVLNRGIYWHKWKPGDLVLWDNLRLLHAATPFDSQKYERLLYRSEFGPHYVPCRPETTVWGYLDGSVKPVCNVASGSVVVVDTVTVGTELPPRSFRDIPSEMYDIIREKSHEKVGPHVLTGPIYVNDAEAGDTLKIEVLDVRLRSDWAWTLHKKSGTVRHTRLSKQRGGIAKPAWGGCLDCQAPFFGVLGVAPPDNEKVSSIPPSVKYGGNLDLKLLSRGAALYLPVNVTGALLFVGDGHARQGNGECCGTAMETSLTGTLRVTVQKNRERADSTQTSHILRAERSDQLISISVEDTIDKATERCLEGLVQWIMDLTGMSKVDTECLCSVAADVSVTQFVNGETRGAHATIAKRHLPQAGA